jgi:hypothetical protein
MKRTFYFISGLLFLIVSSVGFRYTSNDLVSLVNIYLSDTLLLVADERNGLSIYSVADGKNPVLNLTIPLKGVKGMAMKDCIVYASTWDRIYVYRLRKDNGFDSVGSIATYQYRPMGVDGPSYTYSLWNCGCTPLTTPIAGSSSDGGGSYAVFAVIDTFLYYVDQSSLVTMSIADPAKPKELARYNLEWTIETLFPTQQYLFIGGTRGMYIMDRANGARPVMIGSLQHFKACDPVVVQDTIAYVTLRKGNGCGDAADELLSVSIADPKNPKLIGEFGVETPYGLAVRDSLLYISNGYNGYGLYNVNEPGNVVRMIKWADRTTKDFIWSGSTLYIMGFDQVTIMDVADPENPVVVSTID